VIEKIRKGGNTAPETVTFKVKSKRGKATLSIPAGERPGGKAAKKGPEKNSMGPKGSPSSPTLGQDWGEGTEDVHVRRKD